MVKISSVMLLDAVYQPETFLWWRILFDKYYTRALTKTNFCIIAYEYSDC